MARLLLDRLGLVLSEVCALVRVGERHWSLLSGVLGPDFLSGREPLRRVLHNGPPQVSQEDPPESRRSRPPQGRQRGRANAPQTWLCRCSDAHACSTALTCDGGSASTMRSEAIRPGAWRQDDRPRGRDAVGAPPVTKDGANASVPLAMASTAAPASATELVCILLSACRAAIAVIGRKGQSVQFWVALKLKTIVLLLLQFWT